MSDASINVLSIPVAFSTAFMLENTFVPITGSAPNFTMYAGEMSKGDKSVLSIVVITLKKFLANWMPALSCVVDLTMIEVPTGIAGAKVASSEPPVVLAAREKEVKPKIAVGTGGAVITACPMANKLRFSLMKSC